MSRSMTRPGRLVSVVAMAAVVTLALVLVGQRVAVSATPLPDIAADQLLASVAEALVSPPPVSGEIEASLDLGLPSLPVEGADQGPLAAFSGDQRLRVWRSEDGLRVAHLLEAAERALIVSRDEAWTWNSSTAEATRIPFPDAMGEGSHGGPLGDPSMGPGQLDPIAIAGQALAAIEDSTAVSVGRTGRVAGRDTYQLIVEPRTAATLIGRIELDLDAAERLPLRAAVFARDAEAPSIEVGYSSVSFAAIDPATFDFTPPPGSTVTERPPGHHGDDGPVPAQPPVLARPSRVPTVIGEGWATVVAINQIAEATTENAEGEPVSALEALGLALPFSGPLFSARIEDVAGHSFLLVGAVDQSTLEAAASSLQ